MVFLQTTPSTGVSKNS